MAQVKIKIIGQILDEDEDRLVSTIGDGSDGPTIVTVDPSEDTKFDKVRHLS